MNITLNSYTPLVVCSNAIRECWGSHDKSDNGGEKDLALINRVGNQYKHSSTLEHLTYSFTIEGISRACLQELARHRLASYSVKSTRYTLKELKNEEPFNFGYNYQVGLRDYSDNTPHFDTDVLQRASKYLVYTGNPEVDAMSVVALENLRMMLSRGISNDKAKYCLPESYKTSLAWTINARSLQNFISLRTSKAALWEIRDLANAIYEQLPSDHKYLFSEAMKELI